MHVEVCYQLIVPTLLYLVGILSLSLPVYAYQEISDETLKSLPSPNNDFDIHNGAILAPILQPRVPGTPGSLAVREHILQFFKNSLPDWKVELHNITSKTPVTGDKDVPFVNIIATRDPPWAQVGDVSRLTLVAHYDSKIQPTGFIGATDSAAPCAMILHSIRSVDAALTKKWATMKNDKSYNSFLDDHKGIQVLLVDGEEAFKSWTSTDSLYGSRALAKAMEDEAYPAMSTFKSPIRAISLFVLLDLLGEKNPQIQSFSKTTHWAYKNMGHLESRLRQLGKFKSSPKSKDTAGRPTDERLWFVDAAKNDTATTLGLIGDDHVPFMNRGVDILHLIPRPFPRVWHEITDDAEHLDIDTVEDWSTLVTAFVAEWLELEDGFSNTQLVSAGSKEGKSEL